MKPGYLIGILAVLGGIVGYIVFRSSEWYGIGIGMVVGILVGVVVADRLKKKAG